MPPADIDQKIQKARQLGVPEDIIMKRVKTKYPEYGKKSVGGFIQNIGKNVGDIGSGVYNLVNTGRKAFFSPDPQEKSQAMSQTGSMLQNIPGAVAQDVGEFVSNPVDYAYKNPVDVLLSAFPVAKGAAKTARVATKAAKVAVNPKRAVGRAIESRVADAGRIKPEALSKRFGTLRNPNEELVEGIGTARDKSKLLELLRQEIEGQLRYQDLNKTPLYHDIFKLRQGAGQAARYGKGQAATAEQLLNRNIQRAYGEILKEGAGTGRLDKVYNLLSNIEGAGKKALPYGVGGVVAYSLIQKLMNNLFSDRDY